MAGEVMNARMLTKSQQKQSIKGIQKSKKPKVKNYIESPFALEWPKLNPEDEEEVVALLRKSCSGLKKQDCKPPWRKVAKYKGAKRKEFLKLHYQKIQENLNPDSIKKNQEREEAESHLIFGYNAVMRAMEQDRVAGILLKKNVRPDFVTKAFLPGCAKKCIPLVPLNDLDKVVQSKETLALPHACMVLGLRPSVKDELNRFHPLFTKMREALNVEEEEEEEGEDINEEEEEDNESEVIPVMKVEETGSLKPSDKLPKVNISLYHLRRSDNRGRRSFVPGETKEEVNKPNISEDFLSFGPIKSQGKEHRINMSTTEPNKKPEKQMGKVNSSSLALHENIDFASMILLDPSGDENPGSEAVNVEGDSVMVEINKQEKHEDEQPKKKSGKAKKKRKTPDSITYVPTRNKLIKGNLNRKDKHK